MVCVGFLSSLLAEAEATQPCSLHTGSLNDCTCVLLTGKYDSPGTTVPREEAVSRDFDVKLLEVFARHPWVVGVLLGNIRTAWGLLGMVGGAESKG